MSRIFPQLDTNSAEVVEALEDALIESSQANHYERINTASLEAGEPGAGILKLGWDLSYMLQGSTFRIRVGLCESFPRVLPRAYLLETNYEARLPHVDPDRTICYHQAEGLHFDIARPVDLFEEAISRIPETLRLGISEKRSAEFATELNIYLAQLKGTWPAYSLIGAKGQAAVAAAYGVKTRGRINFVAAKSEKEIKEAGFFDTDPTRWPIRTIHIPLEPNAPITPPDPSSEWTSTQLRKLVEQGTSEQVKRELKKLSKSAHRWRSPKEFGGDDPKLYTDLIHCSLPDDQGSHAVFGFLFSSKISGHPLFEEEASPPITAVIFERMDATQLIERGGGRVGVHNKRVAIFGCGSLGGFVADQLALSGVRQFVLVDYERLGAENIYRHSLGKKEIGEFKAEAVSRLLQERLPNMEVEVHVKDCVQVIEEAKVIPSKIDASIFCLGQPTLETAITRYLQSRQESMRTIHAWIEPYGIGGHALLTSKQRSPRAQRLCYECLLVPRHAPTGAVIHNKASFTAPGQNFTRRQGGCGGTYTPYAALHAIRTANLTAELALETLEFPALQAQIRSWKGQARELREGGFKTSRRYAHSEQEISESTRAFTRSDCPNCESQVLE